MEKNYLSKKQQDEILSKERNPIFYILHDGTVSSENPYKGNSQEARNCVEERKRFLRETGGL